MAKRNMSITNSSHRNCNAAVAILYFYCICCSHLLAQIYSDGYLPDGVNFSNCGFNSAATVCALFRRPVEAEDIVNALNLGPHLQNTTDFYKLAAFFRKENLNVCTIKDTSAAALTEFLSGSCLEVVAIIQTSDSAFNHFLLLKRQTGDKLLFLDFPAAKRVCTVKETAAALASKMTGKIMLVSPNEIDSPKVITRLTDIESRISLERTNQNFKPTERFSIASIVLVSPNVENESELIAETSIINNSQADIHILDFKGSCSCFLKAQGDTHLGPFETGKLRFYFSKAQFDPVAGASVAFSLGDKTKPYVVQFKQNMQGAAQLVPSGDLASTRQSVDGEDEPNYIGKQIIIPKVVVAPPHSKYRSEFRVVIDIANTSAIPVEVTDVSGACRCIVHLAAPSRLSPNSHGQVFVDFNRDLFEESSDTTINLLTTDSQLPSASVHITPSSKDKESHTVIVPIQFLDLGKVVFSNKNPKSFDVPILFDATDNDRYEINAVSIQDKSISYKVARSYVNIYEHKFEEQTVSFSLPELPTGEFKLPIIISTSHPFDPQIEVWLHGFVASDGSSDNQ